MRALQVMFHFLSNTTILGRFARTEFEAERKEFVRFGKNKRPGGFTKQSA